MKVAVIIPCFCVKNHIIDVIAEIIDRSDISNIIVVDDCCPEGSGSLVSESFSHKKLVVLFNEKNLGVGGATMRGYAEAIERDCSIMIKMDGDGQMDPFYLKALIHPLIDGRADYAKGNRFFHLGLLEGMPKIRIFGNSLLSIANKFSSGYWNVVDPTNGFTAIHARLLRLMCFDKIDKRYFFESDMLFRLSLLRGVVIDIPMPSRYSIEVSNLRIGRVAALFPFLHLRNFFKRIFYLYFLRDVNVGSILLLAAIPLLMIGSWYGIYQWIIGASQGIKASSGTVMLAALPLIMGFQLLLSFILFDVGNVPKSALHPLLFDDK